MNLGLIIIIVFIIAIAILLFKLIKKVFLALIAFIFVMLIVTAIFGFLVYRDVADLRTNFVDSEKKVFIADDERMLVGFSTDTFSGDSTFTFSWEELQTYNSYYNEKDYSSILGSAYKIFIWRLDSFEGLDEEVETSKGDRISKQSAVNVLTADDAKQAYVDEGLFDRDLESNAEMQHLVNSNENFRQQVIDETVDSDEKRIEMFIILTAASLNEKGPLFIVEQYKEGNIIIYPETMSFKVLKAIPIKFFAGIANKIKKRVSKAD